MLHLLYFGHRNVCLWDTLISPSNTMVHGKKSQTPDLMILPVYITSCEPAQHFFPPTPLQRFPAMRTGPLCFSTLLNSSCSSPEAGRALCACLTSARGSCSTLSRPMTQPSRPWRWMPSRTSSSPALQRATWRWRIAPSLTHWPAKTHCSHTYEH